MTLQLVSSPSESLDEHKYQWLCYQAVARSADPLLVPEILERILMHVILLDRLKFTALFSSAYSAATPSTLALAEIQTQIKNQRASPNRSAFLRVSKFWHEVGKRLLWRDIKLSDAQSPDVHTKIWRNWASVQHLEFEYGKRTNDTGLTLARLAIYNTKESSLPDPLSLTSDHNCLTNSERRGHGDRVTAQENSSGGNSGHFAAVGADLQSGSVMNASASDQADRDQPNIPLKYILTNLASAMTSPPAHCHPNGPPLHPQPLILSSSVTSTRSLLYRSRLKSLTLTGHFQLEKFLITILPLVPELVYLDVNLRCFERRDAIQLGRVLQTCPKLEYLSVERNMVGLVDFGEWPMQVGGDDNMLTPSSLGQDQGTSLDDREPTSESDSDVDWDEYEQELERELGQLPGNTGRYRRREWHLTFAHPRPMNDESFLNDIMQAYEQLEQPTTTLETDTISNNPIPTPMPNGDEWTRRKRQQRLRRKLRQLRDRPFKLKVLKLKKVRIPEEDFLRLIARCPLIEEMDVYNTIRWGWRQPFLDAVARSCPKIRHLHLTTNYNQNEIVVPIDIDSEFGPPALNPAVSSAGITIHENGVHATEPNQDTETNNGLGAHALAAGQTTAQQPYDPVVELIRLFPDLLSYDARYVRFQDRALRTIMNHCRFLERLDLTSCREVSSKAVDRYLRYAVTLKHFSAAKIMLDVEDLIEVVERHRCSDASDLTLPPRWWACTGLETFIIGVKNPRLLAHLPGSQHQQPTMTMDLLTEGATDFRYYYGTGHGGSSSSGEKAGADGEGRYEYDHIQYSTMVLFQHIGRLAKLRRLELHRGRFDLRTQRPDTISDVTLLSSSPSHSLHSHMGRSLEDRPGFDVKDAKRLKGGSNTFQRGLSRMRGLLSSGGSGKGKGRAMDSPGPLSASQDTIARDIKGKKAVHEDNHTAQRAPFSTDGDQEDPLTPSNVYLNSQIMDTDQAFRPGIVPWYLSGLWPLAGLKDLESFNMSWSNFPQLQESELEWICDHWKSIEWIMLGLVPHTEWDPIRSWVLKRRPSIIVAFER